MGPPKISNYKGLGAIDIFNAAYTYTAKAAQLIRINNILEYSLIRIIRVFISTSIKIEK